MLDLNEIVEDTRETRKLLWELWDQIRAGEIKGKEAGKQIGVANGILNSHKVALTAYHILGADRSTPPVENRARVRIAAGRRPAQ